MFDKVKKKDEKKIQDLTKERNDKCIPIANEVLKLMLSGKVEDKSIEELMKDYSDIARDVVKLYLEKDLKLSDVDYVHKLVYQTYDVTARLVQDTLNGHLKRTQKEYWGKDPEDVTTSDLHKKLLEIEKAQ